MRRASALVAATACAVVLSAPAASAVELPPAVADLDVSTLDLRISPIDTRVSPIDTRVSPIDTRVSELETEVEDSEIALNSDILFGFDKATLSPAATAAIREVVADIPDGASVTIDGYTDDIGEDAYNEELSTKRAQAVAKAVAATRSDLTTTAEGHGSADPVEPNSKGGKDNPEGRAKNRRVEISWS